MTFKRCGLSVISLLLLSSSAFADRTLLVPPVEITSSYAGVMSYVDPASGATFKRVCVGADMLSGDNYPALEGVGYGVQRLSLTFTNLSEADATVETNFKSNSNVVHYNSNGAALDYSKFQGENSPQSLGQDKIIRLRMHAKESGKVGLAYHCKSTGCQVIFTCEIVNRALQAGDCDLSSAADINGPNWDTACGNTKQVCLTLKSLTSIEIKALGDRGAILGGLSTGLSRCTGYKSNSSTAMPAFQLNGGRPF